MSEISLNEYKNLLNLNETYNKNLNSTAPLSLPHLHTLLDQTLNHFLTELETNNNHNHNNNNNLKRFNGLPLSHKLSTLRHLLTIRNPNTYQQIPQSIISDIDTILQSQLHHTQIQQAFNLPKASTLFENNNNNLPSNINSFFNKISLWKGDITKLSVDCIVNAANSGLLGCFHPRHLCIDNVIHAAAGPLLRDDCNKIMNLHGKDYYEPNGLAKITRAYNLPSKYVLHTVGPQISEGASITEQDKHDLKQCYISCLNLANEMKLKSIAFCCISTGIFAFPQQMATEIAINTVKQWLTENQNSNIELVIFNVFKAEDEQFYLDQFASLAQSNYVIPKPIGSTNSTSDKATNNLAKAVAWLKNADYVLIAAAAGLSASAGLDFNSTELMNKLHPGMVKAGYPTMYSTIGAHGLPDNLLWGYVFGQIEHARLNWPKTKIYQQLKDIALQFHNNSNINNNISNNNNNANGGISDNNNNEQKANNTSSDLSKFFVLTSNVDGMFEQNDFPLDNNNYYTPQGDYATLQCFTPCSNKSYWPAHEYLNKAKPYIDYKTTKITNDSVIPHCPNCSGSMFLNVRGGDWFLEEPYKQQKKNYKEWINKAISIANSNNKYLVILEIGVGFNTPSVIRWPNELLAETNDCVKLVRINMDESDLPKLLLKADAATSINTDAAQAIQDIHTQVGFNNSNNNNN